MTGNRKLFVKVTETDKGNKSWRCHHLYCFHINISDLNDKTLVRGLVTCTYLSRPLRLIKEKSLSWYLHKDLARDLSSRLLDGLFSAWTWKNIVRFHQIALWEDPRPRPGPTISKCGLPCIISWLTFPGWVLVSPHLPYVSRSYYYQWFIWFNQTIGQVYSLGGRLRWVMARGGGILFDTKSYASNLF